MRRARRRPPPRQPVAYRASTTLWARATVSIKAMDELCEQARLESGLPANEADMHIERKTTNDGFLATRVVVSKKGGAINKLEVVLIISNYDDPTIWPLCVRVPWDTCALTEHSKPTADTDAFDKSRDTGQPPADIDAAQDAGTTPKPRARRNHWDAGPPPADIDAYDKSWDSRQPPADIDAAQDAGTNTYTHPQETGGPHTPHTHTSHTHTRRTLGKRQRSPYTR